MASAKSLVRKLSLFETCCFLVLFLACFSALKAKVISADTTGFVIESSALTEANPTQAYKQFIQVSQWWDPDHSWFGKAENFSLDAQAGGCFCEISGAQQVMHMQVLFVNPPHEIRLNGGLGPLQEMGLNGVMTWTFKATESGQTEVVHRYTVTGYHPDGLGFLAPIVDQVQSSQLGRLISTIKTETPN